MILGLGNDIIEVERVKGVIQRQPKFLDQVFSDNEKTYCLKYKDPFVHFAGLFAVKEAIVKALGTGFRQGLTWLDFEISHDELGKPIVITSALVEQLFGPVNLLISISHCQTYAVATAIWQQ
ncbi:MAG: holo-ACP synthase [Parachlamydiaceae bacterium]|nr:holo-ACP synthase [Parachlamydiaceae bacterium]